MDRHQGSGESPKSGTAPGQRTVHCDFYAVFWSFGLNVVPWIVSADIFPGALRNFSGTWADFVQWATRFPMSKCLPYMFNSFGYGTWFFFASFRVIAAGWSYFPLPETKGLTVDQMDMILQVYLLILCSISY